MIRLRLLGAAEIRVGEKLLTPRADTVFAVLMLLALGPSSGIARHELIELFWPRLAEARGRHNLRQILFRLKRLGVRLVLRHEHIALAPSEVCGDVLELLSEAWPDSVASGAPPSETELLPHFDHVFNDALQQWLSDTRGRIHRQLRRAARIAVGIARQEGRWSDMDAWGSLLLSLDPFDETAVISRAEGLAMNGARSTAIEVLDQYLVEVGDQSQSRGARALRRRIAESRRAWTNEPLPEQTLVGREALLTRVLSLRDEAGRGVQPLLALRGPGGVGKSRLALEMLALSRLRGMRCVVIRATSDQLGRPLSTGVSLALALADLPGAAGVPPEVHAVVTRLRVGSDDRGVYPEPGGAMSGAQLEWILGELLKAISDEQKPLIFLDDVHFCDAASWRVLTAIRSHLSAAKIAVLLAGRDTDEVRGASRDFASLHVPPLDEAATLTLARKLAGRQFHDAPDSAIQRLATRSGGNPLFLTELVSARATQDETSLPHSLANAIQTRLRQLGDESIRVLRFIALLGPHATVERVRIGVTGVATPISLTLEQLEAEGVITFRDQRIFEIHECWLAAVRACTLPAAMAVTAFEAASILLDHAEGSDPAERLWAIADLYALAGASDRGRKILLELSELLFARGLAQQAIEALRRARAMATAPSDSIVIGDRLSHALHLASEFAAAVDCARETLTQSPPVSATLSAPQLSLLATLCDSLWRLGRPYAQELRLLMRGLEDDAIDSEARQYGCFIATRILCQDRFSQDVDRMRLVLERCVEGGRLCIHGALARLMLHAESGSSEEINASAEAVRSFLHQSLAPPLRTLAIRFMALAHRFAGEVTRAIEELDASFELSVSAGFPEEAVKSSYVMVFLLLDEGRTGEAEARLPQARIRVSAASSATVELHDFHAWSRILVQSGRFAECLEHNSTAGPDPLGTHLSRRRAQFMACTALSHAMMGNSHEAERQVEQLIDLIASDRIGHATEFPAEMVLRTLRALGREAAASRFGEAYSVRRRCQYPRRVAGAFDELRRVAQEFARSTHREAPEPVNQFGELSREPKS